MTAICPNCGIDIIPDGTLARDGVRIHPSGVVEIKGEPVHFTAAERIVLSSLIKAAPEIVSSAMLMERTDSGGLSDDVIDVLIHRVRRKIGDAGLIKNIWGRGWCWVSREAVPA